MTNINDISKEIAKALKEYTIEITEGLEKAKLEVAKDTVNNLKESSPKDSGDYAKGWAVKKVDTAQIVHNKTDYQLTHLLEYGHAKVNGGRVSPKVHIRPAEEKAINGFLEKVEKVIKG
jgi:hypothetical protein